MLNEARKEEVLELAKVLISQQSYSGHEGGVAAELEKYMKANGFDDVTVDEYGDIIVEEYAKREKRLAYEKEHPAGGLVAGVKRTAKKIANKL